MIEKVKSYCERLIENSKCSSLPFHNIEHTKEVVDHVMAITEYLGLSMDEAEPIIIAAWFHDSGFSEIYSGHEDVSKRLALAFLNLHKYPSNKIEVVLSCIEATKMPQNCTNQYAEILCDSDVFHIATPDFFYKKLLLRKEWELNNIMVVNDFEWHKLNLKFIHDHHFRTKYGKDVLEKEKLINEEKVKKILSYY